MSEENKGKNEIQKEKVLQAKSGFGMLILGCILAAAGIGGFVWGALLCDRNGAEVLGSAAIIAGTLAFLAGILILCGLKVINPKRGPGAGFCLVIILRNLMKEGFFWVNLCYSD